MSHVCGFARLSTFCFPLFLECGPFLHSAFFLLHSPRGGFARPFFILHSTLRSAATEDGSAFCIRPEVALGGFDPVQLNSEDAKARRLRIRQSPPFHQSRPFPRPDISHP